MAETLSQYIDEIRRRRDLEFSQQMEAVLPMLEADIQRGKQEAEYQKQLGQYRTDLSLMLPEGDERNTFMATPFHTVEGMTSNFTKIKGDIENRDAINRGTTQWINQRKLEGAAPEFIESYRVAAGAAKTPAELQAITQGFDTKFATDQSIRGYSSLLDTIDPSKTLSAQFGQNIQGSNSPEVITAAWKQTVEDYDKANPKSRAEVDKLAGDTLPTKWFNTYKERVGKLGTGVPPMTALNDVITEWKASEATTGGGGTGNSGEISDNNLKRMWDAYSAFVDQKDKTVWLNSAAEGADKGKLVWATVYVDKNDGTLHYSDGGGTVNTGELLPIETVKNDTRWKNNAYRKANNPSGRAKSGGNTGATTGGRTLDISNTAHRPRMGVMSVKPYVVVTNDSGVKVYRDEYGTILRWNGTDKTAP